MELAPRSRILKHSLAELFLKQANNARTDLERVRSIGKAEQLCRELKRDSDDPYPFTTLVKAGLMRLKRAEESEEVLQTEDVEGLIKSVEADLKDGLQRFPGDSHLLALEADLATILCESERVGKALRQSFGKNPRNAYVALQLARLLDTQGDVAAAQKTLHDAIEANRQNTRLHFAYGKLLMAHSLGTNDDLVFHFRHAFSPGDSNYEAQLLYGRQLFIAQRFDEARDTFGVLKRVRLPSHVKRRQQYPLAEHFTGAIERSEAFYCLIRRDGDGALVQFDFDDAEGTQWSDLSKYVRVRFRIAFTMYGAEAFDVSLY